MIATSIGGNVVVNGLSDGSFFTGNHVAGNLEIAESAAGEHAFALDNNQIDGNLKLAKNRGPIRIEGNTLGGDLSVVDNTTDDLVIARNQVRGTVQVNKTRGAAEIALNTITKTLRCTDNTPWPVSVANTANALVGQCAPRAP